MKTAFIDAYINHCLTNNKRPDNVFLFAKAMNIEESEFYQHYSTLAALEADIYRTWFLSAYEQCEQNELWGGYSTREKILAVFYTLIEVIKPNRSFATFLKKQDVKKLPQWPSYLAELNKVFVDKLKPILFEGVSSKELASRKYLEDKYVDAIWLNWLFVLTFWIDDSSAGFEKTDEAIEKSVNLSLDLMGTGPLDAMLNFGKFLFQNR
ncbi:MAG: TetR/AcrR family transcriptional regulator [Bacteroidetes bacterium]|nr:MAG: TetR/AcrR family transcriptional regulator [Bacteroidota bacterium]